MYYWYKLITYLFYPFAPLYLYFRKLKEKEDNTSFKEKLTITDSQRNSGFLIWFHVASVGEAMSILPIIEAFIQDQKVNRILITSITLSSGKILKKRFNNNSKVIHQFLPLDVPMFTKKFLKHWRPDLAIFIDSEIWPNLIMEINKKKIPLLLVNARITKKTFNRWRLLKNFSNKIFKKFNLCIASNEESESYLKILGAKNVKNLGNLKFTNIKNNLNNRLDDNFLSKINNRKIWCAASTHADEEIICAKSHIKIKKIFNNILTIIIPRHINRVERIKKELMKLDLNVCLYSKKEQINSNTDILLVDAYGEALKFYNISKYTFLGKSLAKSLVTNSGQNPIEPARLGCKILHGPNVVNFIEIYNYLKKLGVTKKINNSEELSVSLVAEFKENEDKNQEIIQKIENYGQNIFNNVILELKKYI
ncbi:3-deoxy-D-manno-octulosonic acid transferase [Pelagibacteraceae bacterium]|nr:3-deoxy-D-manno-octulosonic acid transferase [Pelagibacteraceae bacterium]